MTSRLLALPFAALLLATTLSATPARAGGEPLPVALEDLELLPVHDEEWASLMHEHRDLVVRILFQAHRAERVGEHLRAREDVRDAGSAKLLAELDRVRETLRPDLEALLSLLRPFGVDDTVLAVLDDTPRGAFRMERQALRAVLHVPALTPAQRHLLERLVPATEGALLAHAALADRVPGDDLADEIRDLQKRFWRVVDATLDRTQRIALRRRLPARMAKRPDLFAQLLTLPGLEPAQAVRLKALWVGLQQDAAPDQALLQRLGDRLGAADARPAQRLRLERERRAAEDRNLTRFVDAWREGLAVLTEDQRAELASAPPLLAVGERPGDLEAWVAGIRLAPEQARALEALHRRYGPAKGRMLQALARAALAEQDAGEDSPQREAAETMRTRAWGEALGAARKAAHELVTDVLTPEQVLDWVIGNPRH